MSNLMVRMFGITILVLALITAVVPQFTTCESQGKAITLANGNTVPMKCKWTARAELGTAIPLLAVGTMLTASRRKETSRALAAAGLTLGVVVILLPTALIGVCQSLMVCHTVMKPVLITTGGIVTAVSLAGIMLSFKGRNG